ncbi:hypothetical protein HRbin20_01674 [bacterium HR20]|nr:hypothetical protein HRbin20_01674 [bacterium HR20]
MNNVLRLALATAATLALSTTAWATTETIYIFGDSPIVYPCPGGSCVTCIPPSSRVCAAIERGEGNPAAGYPDKATLYSDGVQTSTFNCIYLGPGPSGDPTQDAALIPEP